jgi:Fur family ferric uptake transcriptional regulator
MNTSRSTDAVGAALAVLRSQGLRVSTSRRLVLEALFAAGAPVTADRIATGLGGRWPALDVASVYRNLDTLERRGVVRHLHPGHGPGLYALAGSDPADYLVCDRCGDVRAVDASLLEPVRAALQETTEWNARFSDFPIVGTCPACSSR